MSRPISPYEQMVAERVRQRDARRARRPRPRARQVSFQMSAADAEVLRMVARIDGISVSELVRRAVDAYVAKHAAR